MWRFRRLCGGASCWWSLPDLFLAADKPHNMLPSAWYHSWWPWWRKALRAIGLDAPHFRRAMPTVQQAVAEDDCDLLENAGRVLPSYSLSTFALFALLPRWCGCGLRSASTKAAAASKKWTTFFGFLVDTCVQGGPWMLPLRMDFDAQFVPGMGVIATGGTVHLPVTAENMVILRPLDNGTPQGTRLLQACDFAEELGLVDFMGRLAMKKNLAFGFVQCVGHLAAKVEARFASPAAQSEKASDKSAVLTAVHAQSLGRFGKTVKQTLKHSRRARMLQYLLAGRRHFDSSEEQLAFSGVCDAGRFGRRECMLIAVGTPDNVVMWAPPVVHPHKKTP